MALLLWACCCVALCCVAWCRRALRAQVGALIRSAALTYACLLSWRWSGKTSALLLDAWFEILGEVAKDHFVQALFADEVLAKDAAAF